MKPLFSVMGRELAWFRPRIFSRNYELRTAHEVIATMKFSPMRNADVVIGGVSLHFDGRMPPRIRATISRDGVHVADVAYGFRSGTLTMRDGRTFKLQGAWPLKVIARDASDQLELLRTGRLLPGFTKAGGLEVGSAGWSHPELPLLAAVSWYVLIMRIRRAARAG